MATSLTRDFSSEQRALKRRVVAAVAGGFKIVVFMGVFAVSGLLLVGGYWQQELEARTAQPILRVEPLTLETAKGSFTLNVEIAETTESIRRGLAKRETLAADGGMLVHWAKRHSFRHDPAPARVRMKHTLLPLDIVFTDSSGVVLAVDRGEPETLTPVRCEGDVEAFLQLAAGAADTFAIEPGDRLRHSMFDITVE